MINDAFPSSFFDLKKTLYTDNQCFVGLVTEVLDYWTVHRIRSLADLSPDISIF